MISFTQTSADTPSTVAPNSKAKDLPGRWRDVTSRNSSLNLDLRSVNGPELKTEIQPQHQARAGAAYGRLARADQLKE
jgi:hypothetical protein